MNLPEIKNPIRNGRIEACDFEPEEYVAHGSDIKRGNPRFIMNRGELMNFASNPQRWIRGYANEADGPAVQWGSYIDALVTMPMWAAEKYVCAPETYPSEGMKCPKCGSVTDAQTCRKCKTDRVKVVEDKPWDWAANYCDQWREDRPGKVILKKAIYDDGGRAITSLMADTIVNEIISCSKRQVFVLAEYADADTGITIPVKMLIDLVPEPEHPAWGMWLFDFKTTHSAGHKAWQTHVFEQNYHVQAAFFMDGYVAATGEDRNTFGHIVQENFWPFVHGRRMLSSEFLTLGRLKYLDALRAYCACLNSNEWPDYDAAGPYSGFSATEPKDWMMDI